MEDVEALEDVLELRVELVEVGAVHVVPVAPHEGHALRREAVGALVELPHHVKALRGTFVVVVLGILTRVGHMGGATLGPFGGPRGPPGAQSC